MGSLKIGINHFERSFGSVCAEFRVVDDDGTGEEIGTPTVLLTVAANRPATCQLGHRRAP